MSALPNISLPPDLAAPVRHSRLGWFAAGLRACVSVPGLVLFATYVGFGGLISGVGFPLSAGLLSTVLMWALPAQVILVSGLAAGTSLPALALAICLSGVRLTPMVVAVLPLLRGRRSNVFKELFCAHFVAVTMWVEGQRRLPLVPVEGRPAYAVGLGGGLIAMSACGVGVGYFVTDSLPGPLAVALLLLTPISFSILMVRNASVPADWLALVFGFVLAPLVADSAGGLDLFWAGGGGGTLAFLAARLLGRAA
ncbi:MAG TPA: AzlC family ABC transporter permease [Xanthobacteraceae bacterium]|nr:AzlC family ABC transporter permease [Xanthobacteraceae bacterium]